MTEAHRKKRNEERLAQLYPTFRTRLQQVLTRLEANGVKPRIQEAWRSPAAQMTAYASGHSKLRFGFHNVTDKQGRPEALAVDLLDDEAPLTPSTRYLLQLAAAAEQSGLVTGIRWGVPSPLTKAINAAIAAKDWSAAVKVGWDPTHVQPTGMTIAEAKAGKRPA